MSDEFVGKGFPFPMRINESGSFTLIDNSSLNGTYLNNISIQKNVLKSGDEIQIGKFHFVFIGSTK